MLDSFGSHGTLSVGGASYRIARLAALEKHGFRLDRLPYALRILLENLLRREDGRVVTRDEITALAGWQATAQPAREIAFTPARVLLQDFTGVPAVVDLAAMRDAMRAMGGDPERINPLQPVELVIDHSVQVDEYGSDAALLINSRREFERNHERYLFLRWGQKAFRNFRVVPPATGIVHQVNLEYLARVVMDEEGWAYPDTLVGTDSHTTMVNGLGVLGWGVGGIEAEAAMLGQPVSMLIPQVVGFRLTGRLAEGATATDLVLTITQMLRQRGVVGKFVEFYGPGLAQLRLADRATIANMAPEYGATCGISRSIESPSTTSPSPAARPSGWRWSRRTCANRGCSTTPTARPPTIRTTSSSTWARSRPRSPARGARRTASSSRRCGRTSSPSCQACWAASRPRRSPSPKRSAAGRPKGASRPPRPRRPRRSTSRWTGCRAS